MQMEDKTAMDESGKVYIAIDLKSFYASVECVERGIDPLDSNLVVADTSRSEKTICLAVSPALKARGVPSRPRLFEVIEKVRAINAQRCPGVKPKDRKKSWSDAVLREHPDYAVSFIAARPRMSKYIEYSSRVVSVYLKYVAPEDLDVYSIDEVFIDATSYLRTYGMSARDLAMTMVRDVLATTGVTATAGIGTNLYLAKIAMDIVAKHQPADADGVRIAELDEMSYRRLMWRHEPITDFWRVGHGIASRLASVGIKTMGDIARCSEGSPDGFYNEALLYSLFGVNAELLIDHAWGWEGTTMADIKALRPRRKSLGVGQVLQRPYPYDQARLAVWEMAEQLSLDLVAKGYMASKAVLVVGYDAGNLKDPSKAAGYRGGVKLDYIGRAIPVHARGTVSFGRCTSSTRIITKKVTELFERIVNHTFTVRRLSIAAIGLERESEVRSGGSAPMQTDLFVPYEDQVVRARSEERMLERERKVQKAVLDIKNRHGKNAVFRGADLEEGATTLERNLQIGGHRA
jgi:DNA polymerase V